MQEYGFIARHIPEELQNLLLQLEQAGHEAFLVGGCVRDAYMDLAPSDFDIATSALPDEVLALFAGRKCLSVGKAFGTVIVPYKGGHAEVTTFREEGDYTDGRHPDTVRFTRDIYKDLGRRDFTMNAMAWHRERGLLDPFGGREDIRKKRLRAVGEADRRLREDALRILRGVRFAARFDLTPDETFLAAATRQAERLQNISAERILSEMDGMLLVNVPSRALRHMERMGVLPVLFPEIHAMVGLDQESPYHHLDLFSHSLCVMDGLPADLDLRWAALLHDAGKPETKFYDENGIARYFGHDKQSEQRAAELLTRLRAPHARTDKVKALIRHHMANANPYSKKSVKKLLRRLGPELLQKLFLLQEADCACATNQGAANVETGRRLLEEILHGKEPFSAKHLAIDGGDLLSEGIPEGPEIGHWLNWALDYVQEDPETNTKPHLLAKINENRRRQIWENTSAPTESGASRERN